MIFSEKKLPKMEDKEIVINGDKVLVKQYLPLKDKMSILEMVIQTADAGTILNTLVLDAIFETYLVFKYTDIEFTDEEKENLLDTYDALELNGIIEQVVTAIPKTEYKILRDNLEQMIIDYKDYRNSAKGCVDAISIFAPEAATKFNEAIAQMDTAKLENVVHLAGATGFRS